ncbi:hypothetical protein D6D17_03159 [Aureobasidium pullulans]|uniref:Apple domain-containing protein n=1 Tax=Aureobasidium pullulans TaxID=5580 RepID=A0A4S8S8R5_AURPU|nr:hypothetical protein D6D28_08142 [Aureobasidium pullulans]THX14831.1 hypothetical protein D6D17_03159 [Aureobasidium pullulans]
MRFSSYALPALAANLVAALPAPQEIDLDMVLDTPDPTFSEAVGVVAQTITYDTASLIAVATAAASSVSIEISDVLSQTAVVSKRAAPATCVPQPSGATSAPTYAAGTDNAANFLANNYYASVASAAPTPTGYNMAFVNQQASNNAFGYLGFDTLDTYDVATCASRCSAKNGCVSINIYFERDPSVDPNAASCSNPASVTMIKCVYWGGPVSQDNAVNTGQTRGSFSVVIAGSNGYVTNQIKTPAGYQAGTPYGKYAINAPYDAQGYNTFMGSKIFTSTWDVASCSAYCDSQTAYNKATAPKDGTPYKVCNFFNTYVLTAYKADGTVVPQGQYCALYTEAWTSTYATNAGQWRGQDQYLVNYSFGYPKSSPGVSPTVGDVKGAAYQALADIKWSSLQPFCSTLLGYTVPVSSVTALTTTTPIVTSTVYSSTTILKRAAQTTPAGLAKYQAPVLSSACSMAVTSPTITSTVTAATSTVVAVAQTSTVTAVTTITAPKPGSCSNGATCGSYDIKYDSANRIYLCGLDVTGAAVCVYDTTCDAQQCSSNSACASGETCLAQSCCGYAVCVSVSNECANSNSAKFLFNRRNTNVARDSSECTAASCPSKVSESQTN